MKEISPFEATKKMSNNLENLPYLNYNQAHTSGTREGFSATGLFVTKLKNTLYSWICNFGYYIKLLMCECLRKSEEELTTVLTNAYKGKHNSPHR